MFLTVPGVMGDVLINTAMILYVCPLFFESHEGTKEGASVFFANGKQVDTAIPLNEFFELMD